MPSFNSPGHLRNLSRLATLRALEEMQFRGCRNTSLQRGHSIGPLSRQKNVTRYAYTHGFGTWLHARSNLTCRSLCHKSTKSRAHTPTASLSIQVANPRKQHRHKAPVMMSVSNSHHNILSHPSFRGVSPYGSMHAPLSPLPLPLTQHVSFVPRPNFLSLFQRHLEHVASATQIKS
jgi:hypothetical protein